MKKSLHVFSINYTARLSGHVGEGGVAVSGGRRLVLRIELLRGAGAAQINENVTLEYLCGSFASFGPPSPG
jgi:hypothetical protein